MNKYEQAVRAKYRRMRHVRAALASIKIILEDCRPEDRKDLLEAKSIIEGYEDRERSATLL